MPKLVSIQVLWCEDVAQLKFIPVDKLWTLQKVFEGIANGTESYANGGRSRYVDPRCRLITVCKVGTSQKGDFLLCLALWDALEFGKYFQFILQEDTGGTSVVYMVAGSSAPYATLD